MSNQRQRNNLSFDDGHGIVALALKLQRLPSWKLKLKSERFASKLINY